MVVLLTCSLASLALDALLFSPTLQVGSGLLVSSFKLKDCWSSIVRDDTRLPATTRVTKRSQSGSWGKGKYNWSLCSL